MKTTRQENGVSGSVMIRLQKIRMATTKNIRRDKDLLRIKKRETLHWGGYLQGKILWIDNMIRKVPIMNRVV